MLRNYLLIAYRNLLRHKFYSLINIFGFAIGMACCIFIVLFVINELSYDRFIPNHDRLFRVVTNYSDAEAESTYATSPPPLANALINELPEVEAATQVLKWNDFTVRPSSGINHRETFREDNVYYAEKNFFEVFDFPLLKGDKNAAFENPPSAVLTKSKAIKYFGKEAYESNHIVGNTLLFGASKWPCKIGGIVADPPENSHFKFDMLLYIPDNELLNMNHWSWPIVHTYLLLKENVTQTSVLDEKLNKIVQKYVVPFMLESNEVMDQDFNFSFSLQPITDIHLKSHFIREHEENGNILNIYILSCIALFVIIIASVNFINLSTAQSFKRGKEIGVRKVMGAFRIAVILQFLIEAFLMVSLAMIIAVTLVQLFAPAFSTIIGKSLSLNLIDNHWYVPAFILLILLITFLAGGYPAFYISHFRPSEVLKGRSLNKNSKTGFRNSLLVFQFMISIGLIICTILIFYQLQYISNKNLGFEKENVIVIHNDGEIKDRERESFRDLLKQNPKIISSSFSTGVPASQKGFHMRSFRQEHAASDVAFNWYQADDGYLETLKLQLIDGRGFTREMAGDTAGLILNETAVKLLGLEDPIGQYVILNKGANDEARLIITGVVKDFNFESLHHEIEPLGIQYLNQTYLRDYISIRIAGGNTRATIEYIENAWKSFIPEIPITYSFLDEDFDRMFKAEQQMGLVFGIFTGLAIFTACFGLFGLTSFTIEQRTKEIGIRKVMGANVTDIAKLLSKDFLKLLLLANILAWPIAWYFMEKWLESFAFRIHIAIWVFLLAAGLAIVLALTTILFKSIKAAKINPVNSLRWE